MNKQRFFIDHGAIHDRVTGKHVAMIHTDDDWQKNLLELLNELWNRRPQQSAEPVALNELREMWLNFPGLSVGSLSSPCIREMSPEQADFYAKACEVAIAASPGPSELVEEMEKLEAELTHTGRSATSYEEGFHDGQNQCADRLSALITRHRGSRERS